MGKRRDDLNQWLSGLETMYAERILAVDHETTRIWGELSVRAVREGRAIGAVDGLIAAIALRHGLHLVTRNIKDFEASGALLINPW